MEIWRKQNKVSRSVSPENFTAEKGKGGMAEHGTGENCARELGKGWKISPSVVVRAGSVFTLADIHASGVIRHVWCTDNSVVNRSLVLRAYWDGSCKPSVEVPLGDFFAAADYQKYAQINSLAVCVNPKRGLNCYWEMPFAKQARFTVENVSARDITLYYQIDYTEEKIPSDALYFHAQFRRTNPVPYMEVHTLLDNINAKGQYVGTYMYWGVNNNGWWGEGEIKFYLDGDKQYPTICGTGTEDYFCGAYDFEDNDGHYRTFSSPYSGLSCISDHDDTYKSNRRFSMYRWHLADPVFFDENIRVTMQALGWRSEDRYLPLMDDISSVAYFYADGALDVSGTIPDANGLEII